MNNNHKDDLLQRFVRYAKIDTQSNPNSKSVPSSEKQKDLGKLLVQELLEMGYKDAEMDPKGYVYATIPSSVAHEVPVICFCAHMDTSPDCPATHVQPVVHSNYNGGNLILPKEGIVLKPENHPDLSSKVGETIITSDGSTLLGADNKAGVASIMQVAKFLSENKEVRHGKIRLLFTPDEEIGRGADHVDIQKLGADFGYTIDGETLGSLEDETFSADMVTIQIQGVSAHPGFAKGRMINAIKVASEFITKLPNTSLSPETSEGREGFIHPISIEGGAEKAKIQFIVRSFVDEELYIFEKQLELILKTHLKNYPKCSYTFEVVEQYRNMKSVLDQHPNVVKFAEEAIEKAGITLKKRAIRGGTDGSRLSFMGLPCPNIFAGEHAFHSREEWVSLEDMMKSMEVMLNLSERWAKV